MKKKIALAFTALVLSVGTSKAQKFAYVDTEYILGQMPEYKSAQSQLDAASAQWQKEIEAKYADIDKLYKAFQAEQVLLSDEMKHKREDEIIQREKDAKDFQKSKFGVDGELFKKRQELVKPLQDKVYNAVKEIAGTQQYAVIFDKSSDLTMIYTNPKFDKSDEVLKAMGYKVVKQENKTGQEAKPTQEHKTGK
ncbi:MAG: OmpH family outer membrane protein [Bacteroidia bacterium]|nr:OmpH family outer membrane protein [Bacteroidia bacterium]